MKGKIDTDGCLHIERRAGKLKRQRCPHAADTVDEFTPCGDWCPLFGSIEYSEFDGVCIEICHAKYILFDKLVDERNGAVYTRQSVPEILKASKEAQVEVAE